MSAERPRFSGRRGRAFLLSLVLFLVLLRTERALGHDMWLEVEQSDGALEVFQTIGHLFETVDRFSSADPRIARFEYLSSEGGNDILGNDPGSRKLSLPEASGARLVILERSPSRVDLDREAFVGYLDEEGHVEALREVGRTGSTVFSEAFSRHLKLIIDDGSGDDARIGEATGLELEITPLSNPARLDPGERFEAQLTFRGEPMQGVELTHYYQGESGEPEAHVASTGEDGVAVFTVAESDGYQIVRTTVLHECVSAECSTDYRSLWATLSWRPAGRND